MTEAEARSLVTERARVLRLLQIDMHEQLQPLIAATGGNPKAIEITLGLVKHERRSLSQVVEDLMAARGELFNDLFARAWELVDEPTKQVLMSMTLFPSDASEQSLAHVAGLSGFAFDRAIERLVDLALLDVNQPDLQTALRARK